MSTYLPLFGAAIQADNPSTIGLSTIISLISLLIAAGTFFLTQLRAARITPYFGPNANLGYPAPGAGFSLTVPVTFTNHGSRTGAVLRSAAILWRKEWPEERYFMQWDSFVKEDFITRRWTTDEVAHALAIPGKSIVAKNITYGWRADSTPPLHLKEATYCISFLYWTKGEKPHHEIHDVPITAEMIRILDAPIDDTNRGAINVTLDTRYKVNETLNTAGFQNRVEGH
jgi:hypothetical protein